MTQHRLPPTGSKGLCVLATDGQSVARVIFGDADTGCQHSPDGDLVITRARHGGRRRVTASFPAGTWVLAAWILGEEADGRLQLEDIEWPRQQRTGDAAAVDAAVAADHAWFATNPSATGYLRHALPGEWSANRVGEPPIPGAVLLVQVRRVAPGLNSRQPAWALRLQPAAQSSPHVAPAQENE